MTQDKTTIRPATGPIEDNLDTPLKDVLEVIHQRHRLKSTYFGIRAQKNPFDFWVYQELIHDQRPDVIIEIGNNYGGSTLALAHLCDLLDHGRVIGIDITHGRIPERVKTHPRVTLIEGDACELFNEAQALIKEGESVFLIEDSSHTYANTLNVLRTYGPLVKPGGYFIVEDGTCHHGIDDGPSPGPYEAVEAFIAEGAGFLIDRTQESFLITHNAKGFLRRTEDEAGLVKERAEEVHQPPPLWHTLIRLLTPPIFIIIAKKIVGRA